MKVRPPCNNVQMTCEGHSRKSTELYKCSVIKAPITQAKISAYLPSRWLLC
jgi:hypothetical protein